MQEKMMRDRMYETDAPQGYEELEFEAKNATKFMSTFPYPYMNGFLHLGKRISFCRVSLTLVVNHGLFR